MVLQRNEASRVEREREGGKKGEIERLVDFMAIRSVS